MRRRVMKDEKKTKTEKKKPCGDAMTPHFYVSAPSPLRKAGQRAETTMKG
jgi:hypothetical protein